MNGIIGPQYTVTPANFSYIRKRIAKKIGNYALNVEKWVVEEFDRIAPQPSEEAILALQRWILRFLPESTQRHIFVQRRKTLHKKVQHKTLILSTETYEQLRGIQKSLQLPGDEEVIRVLLATMQRSTPRCS